MAQTFAASSPQDLADLIAGHPLAWLCAQGDEGLVAGLLPLLPQWSAQGCLESVEGHLARHHALVPALRARPRALALWLGEQAYVSPSWLQDRTQAPSWIYASAQCALSLQFDESEGAIEAHLERLTAVHEAGRPQAWQPAEMGARLGQLAARVIMFKARVETVHERYKLGQDEREDVYAAQRAHLAGTPVVAWMQRFEAQRGQPPPPAVPQASSRPLNP